MMRRDQKRSLAVVAAVAVVLGAGSVAALATVLPHVAGRALVDAPNAGHTPICDEAVPEGADRQLWVDVGDGGDRLHAWVFEPAEPTGTILILHGIEGRGSMMADQARRFERLGFRAVAVDLRGHGCSTGEWATYGATDATDLSMLLDALPADGPVGVLGSSYGGGAALQLAAADSRVRAVVTVATFSSFRDLAHDHAQRHAGAAWPLVPEVLVQTVIDAAGAQAGFDPDQARSVAAIARTDASVLIVHGTDDTIVPIRHAFALRDAAPGHSRLVVLPGHDHDSIQADPDGTVAAEAASFFTTHLAAPASERIASKVDPSDVHG